MKAKILEESGDSEAAIEWYDKEIEQAESFEVKRDAYIGLAIAYEHVERIAEAVGVLETTDRSRTGQHRGTQGTGPTLHPARRPGEGERVLEQVTLMGDADPNILYNLGADRYNAGELDKAAGYFAAGDRHGAGLRRRAPAARLHPDGSGQERGGGREPRTGSSSSVPTIIPRRRPPGTSMLNSRSSKRALVGPFLLACCCCRWPAAAACRPRWLRRPGNAAGAKAEKQSSFVEHSSVELVQIEAVVLDRRGRHVRDLPRGNFSKSRGGMST